MYKTLDTLKKTKISNRPSYVDDLFKKYDYEDIQPKSIQTMTKNTVLCFSVIKEIYFKITNWVGK